MGEISAKDVAALRQATGAGMMDCKRALEATGGDMEQARRWLREQGLAAAAKRAGREAREGAVQVIIEDGIGVIAELTCETDFVAKSDEVGRFLDDLARTVFEYGEDDLASRPLGDSTVEEATKALAARVGENVSVGRVVRFEVRDGILDGYLHIQNERGVIGVLAELGGVDPADPRAREVTHDLALHIASASPRWLRREDVPEEVVAEERAVLETLTRNEGKPEAAIPKIVEGRLQGFFKEHCLLEQPFVRDPKRTVGSLVEEVGGEVRRFARVKVGED